ncbi:cellulase [Streptomyces luteolifulvus]|uniref:Cellulase n=1 Tax=Streptomyces luteolifulvus TaxID=2615112 RepID=A0A6H9V9A6_9ACTN|nr:cellulase [Streptomyces luteolifulvus]KAB1150118.1 cellulase [Streptomyces luteolifulvus]
MDHFERELSRMMRDAREHTPFEPAHQARLRSGVRARRRARAAQKAVGSVLAVAGLGIGFFLLPDSSVETRPQAPLPRPAASPASPTATPSTTADSAPSATVTAPPTGSETSAPPGGPATTGSSDTLSPDPGSDPTNTPPPTSDVTRNAPTPEATPTSEEPSSFVTSTDSG